MIDCSGAYALDSDVPLVLSGFNTDKIKKAEIIALPSSQVSQLVKALQKVTESHKIERMILLRLFTEKRQWMSCLRKHARFL